MQYDVLVVGAGVVGCATAMELGKYSLRAAVIEAGDGCMHRHVQGKLRHCPRGL